MVVIFQQCAHQSRGYINILRAHVTWCMYVEKSKTEMDSFNGPNIREHFFFFFKISTDLSGAPLNKQACCLPIGHGTYRWTMGRLVTASLICFSCSLQLKGFKGSPANFSLSDTFNALQSPCGFDQIVTALNRPTSYQAEVIRSY